MPNAQIQNPKRIFQRYNIKPLKRLGQNFLIDKKVLEKIIEAAELPASPPASPNRGESQGGKPTDIVLEIGPGLGVLTIELAKRVKRVIAVEKDRKICEVLAHVLDVENVVNVEIVQGDILQPQQLQQLQQLQHYKLIANLPYYITSPVIRKFLECNAARPRCMILMIQKEVAQRIVAKPPKMNLLAVAVQFYAEPKIISYVSKKSFWPQPKVDSAIIKIVPRAAPKIDTKLFFEIVRKGFSSKRKMLKNNLKIDESVLKDLGLNPKIRAENLSIDNWIKLLKVI